MEEGEIIDADAECTRRGLNRHDNRRFCHQLAPRKAHRKKAKRRMKQQIGFIGAFNVRQCLAMCIDEAESDRPSEKSRTIKVTLRLRARVPFAFAQWIGEIKWASKKVWRARLKSPELCLILRLSGHNTHCCVSSSLFFCLLFFSGCFFFGVQG